MCNIYILYQCVSRARHRALASVFVCVYIKIYTHKLALRLQEVTRSTAERSPKSIKRYTISSVRARQSALLAAAACMRISRNILSMSRDAMMITELRRRHHHRRAMFCFLRVTVFALLLCSYLSDILGEI